MYNKMDNVDQDDSSTTKDSGAEKLSYKEIFDSSSSGRSDSPSPKRPLRDFRDQFLDAAQQSGFTQEEMDQLMADMDRNPDSMIDYEEFCEMMAKCSRDFKKRMQIFATKFVLPKSQREDSLRYIDQYNCCPPPIFIILITLIQVSLHIYHYAKLGFSSGEVKVDSPLIWAPKCRFQAWRFVTYMFVHAGHFHIVFNVVLQLGLGLPMEMVHKFWRFGIIYVGGVIAGALAHSIFDYEMFLAGASGGVYAVFAAHISNVIINYAEMEFAKLRIAVCSLLVAADAALAIYDRYKPVPPDAEKKSQTSYAAHIAGLLVGILLGIVVLKNLKWINWEKAIWYISLVGAICVFLFGVFWNIFNPYDTLYTQVLSLGSPNFLSLCYNLSLSV